MLSREELIQRWSPPLFTGLLVTSLPASMLIMGCCAVRKWKGHSRSSEIIWVCILFMLTLVTDSLNGDYILVNSASNEKKYFFWPVWPAECRQAAREVLAAQDEEVDEIDERENSVDEIQ